MYIVLFLESVSPYFPPICIRLSEGIFVDKHPWQKQKGVTKGDDFDPLDDLIQKSGCMEQHLATIDCMAEHQDWRKCQQTLKDFRTCMAKSQKSGSQP